MSGFEFDYTAIILVLVIGIDIGFVLSKILSEILRRELDK